MTESDSKPKPVPPRAVRPLPFSQTEYAARRQALMDRIGDDAVAVVPAGLEHRRNNDIEHLFRQSSDLLYLTGFAEPEAVAVIVPKREDGEYVLFCRERDAEKEIWQGHRVGLEGAQAEFAADQAFAIDKLDEEMPNLLQERHVVYFDLGQDFRFDERMIGWLTRLRRKARAGVHAPSQIVFLSQALHEQRLIKRPAELALLQEAADIGVAAHRQALQVCRPGAFEHTLEAELLHSFRRRGAVPSYPPIVATGANACVLHYTENNMPLRSGDLVLIDAGAERHGYASDITRTFPVSGTFTAAQRDVYELVLAAQSAALAECRPGQPWDAPHLAALRCLTQGLLDFGLLTGEIDTLIEEEAYKPFFMHKTGHWLGLDVHDVGVYKTNGEWRRLQPGMCLTVEPGLYLAPENEKVPKALKGIGVRIEDDVLITDGGHRVLTAALPKAPDAIAELVGGTGE